MNHLRIEDFKLNFISGKKIYNILKLPNEAGLKIPLAISK